MKIVHVCETLKGGIESYLAEIIPYQVGLYGADNIHIIVPRDGDEGRSEFHEAVVWEFRRQGRSLSTMLNLCLAILKIVRTQAPDVIHLHSSFAGAIGRVVLMALRKETKVIYCPHGWSYLRQGAEHTNWLWKKIETMLALACNRIVCISEHEYNAALDAGLPKQKLELIVSGISDVVPDAPRNQAVSSEKRAIRLLFVGRLDYQKGVDLLFNALRLAARKDIELTVVGEAVVNSGWWAQVRGSCPENVQIIGWQERDALQIFYDLADALVVPSRWEGFGLVAVEALRAGTPVICNVAGALPDIVEHGISGYHLDFENEEKAVAFFSDLKLENLTLLRRAARERYTSVFKSQAMNEKMLQMYQTVMPHAETVGAAGFME
ncbi:glycosyltransferase [Paraburkholderia xenovorans]|uniref:glycosyltransferase n=1 Tax=Paraburkholderia xenovorans TaxID=36873 RepID=UPI0015587D57|nr:glycosyltransferase [Paraburkholderia xenovorans]NPT38427.1 glycosyltransferase [Paraburkholderia xenovorans]